MNEAKAISEVYCFVQCMSPTSELRNIGANMPRIMSTKRNLLFSSCDAECPGWRTVATNKNVPP